MLQLGTGMQTIEGVTVFPDHADEEQFWYLPAHIDLARRAADDRPEFTFIKYKRAATPDGVEGGGFLMFGVELALPDDVERAIRSQIPGGSRLAAVPFDSGTVKCVALNLEGPGGTVAQVSGEGTFVAVEQILGASVPGLFGKNKAIFSLTLSAEGATLLEAALSEGGTPIGVIYDFAFTALQPALDVTITADFERIYDHFSAGLNANIYYVEVGIEVGLEELIQTGAIKIEVTNFSTAEDRKAQEDAAINLFKDTLLTDWFEPTLSPGALQGGMASAPRAGGGAALFGQGSASDGRNGSGSSRPERPDRPAAPGRPGQPGRPGHQPPSGGVPGRPGQQPPSGGVPGRPGQQPPSGGVPGRPGQQPPSGGVPGRPGQQSPSGGVPGRPGQQPPSGGGTPQPVPVPEGSGGAAAGDRLEPAESNTKTAVVIDFQENGGAMGLAGRWHVTISSGGEQSEAAMDESTMASQLMMEVPATWRECAIGVETLDLPQLATSDEGQLRQMFEAGHSDGVMATGRRQLASTLIGDVHFDPTIPASLFATVNVPTTNIRINAASADALIQAIFPGGSLASEGIYDARRLAGTNDFLLLTAGEASAVEQTISGGSHD